MNKSPDFEEVTDRSQLDISEPYKVYRIVPEEEQKCECPEEGTGQGTALAGADLHLSGACGADPIAWGRALCPFLGPGGGEGAGGERGWVFPLLRIWGITGASHELPGCDALGTNLNPSAALGDA